MAYMHINCLICAWIMLMDSLTADFLPLFSFPFGSPVYVPLRSREHSSYVSCAH